jgi:hypothetical protein
MIVYLLNINDEPIEPVFLTILDVAKYIEACVQTMDEYSRIDIFKVHIPQDTPGNKRHEVALATLLKKREALEAELDALSTWEISNDIGN